MQCNFNQQNISDNNLHLRTTQTLLDELRTLIIANQVKPCLEHINSLLTNAILKCKTAIDSSVKSTSMPQPFSNEENIAPGRKLTTSGNLKRLLVYQAGKRLLIN